MSAEAEPERTYEEALTGASEVCASAPANANERAGTGEFAAELALARDLTDVDVRIDPTQADLSSSTCRRVCACCSRNGNRFCCSHCRFCSGPIGVIGEPVLSPE